MSSVTLPPGWHVDVTVHQVPAGYNVQWGSVPAGVVTLDVPPGTTTPHTITITATGQPGQTCSVDVGIPALNEFVAGAVLIGSLESVHNDPPAPLGTMYLTFGTPQP